MKANFKLSKSDETPKEIKKDTDEKKADLTEEEFEEYMVKSGAAGSFMVFRSDRSKEDELGLDEI